jgi:hypothetical protein
VPAHGFAKVPSRESLTEAATLRARHICPRDRRLEYSMGASHVVER